MCPAPPMSREQDPVKPQRMTTNPAIPRALVSQWSQDIGASPIRHKPAMLRIMRRQRNLLKWTIQNGRPIELGSSGLPERMLGLIARLFDLCGGRLKPATAPQIEQCQQRVMSSLDELLPADSEFPSRVRTLAWRAQPHILDEILDTLFHKSDDSETSFNPTEAFKLALLLWVCVEVLDENWQPPSSFRGEP